MSTWDDHDERRIDRFDVFDYWTSLHWKSPKQGNLVIFMKPIIIDLFKVMNKMAIHCWFFGIIDVLHQQPTIQWTPPNQVNFMIFLKPGINNYRSAHLSCPSLHGGESLRRVRNVPVEERVECVRLQKRFVKKLQIWNTNSRLKKPKYIKNIPHRRKILIGFASIDDKIHVSQNHLQCLCFNQPPFDQSSIPLRYRTSSLSQLAP